MIRVPLFLLLSLLFVCCVLCYPSARYRSSSTFREKSLKSKYLISSPAQIGPDCTMNAHAKNPPGVSVCPMSTSPFSYPTMQNQTSRIPHQWAPYYTVDWNFYYVFDEGAVPPYTVLPPQANYTVSAGVTYYDSTVHGGAMRETYFERCIPIFFEGLLAPNNNYSCDYINLADTNTAYLWLHDDRPVGAPECCIIGQPFHPPPRRFADNLYILKQSVDIQPNTTVDWYGLTLVDAGLFMYGYYHDTIKINNKFTGHVDEPASRPYAFYMMGAPQIATWMYQKFGEFDHVSQPDPSVWKIPDACSSASVCPGWG